MWTKLAPGLLTILRKRVSTYLHYRGSCPNHSARGVVIPAAVQCYAAIHLNFTDRKALPKREGRSLAAKDRKQSGHDTRRPLPRHGTLAKPASLSLVCHLFNSATRKTYS